jgi:RNA polymerase sigma-70 factor (ECF subfamily)
VSYVCVTGPEHSNTENIKSRNQTLKQLFEQCFNTWYHNLFGYAFSLVRNKEEAAEIVQLSFIKLWEKRTEVDIPCSGRSYLYSTVHNLALNHLRHTHVKRKFESYQKYIGEVSDQKHLLEQREKVERIEKTLESLPPACREIFIKSRFEQKKYAEIASELNISIKTVEAQVGKALKILRQQLADIL